MQAIVSNKELAEVLISMAVEIEDNLCATQPQRGRTEVLLAASEDLHQVLGTLYLAGK